ncbi:DUF4169 family protein [Hyphomonas sp.]|jgi:hypothetical protein|uniref:DUF4169 family protein n=1 Tax=Hyphomonas sp. TaxID=87 RepID=UPI000AA366F0|nr:DUF4169 family protein [Hyphomonas sp.]MBA4338513.1 DUF4169 domain-containing protein [Hyphomonas sp.]
MTTPINLNKARKAKEKADAEQRAKENRAKFGRTKAEKKLEAAKAEKQAKQTEGHRRERPDPKDG